MKIALLPLADALTGEESFPLVQDNDTAKVSLTDLESFFLASTEAVRDAAVTAKTEAQAARDIAVPARVAAEAARDIAIESADLASNFLYGGLSTIHPTVAEGLAATPEGKCFLAKGEPDTIVASLYQKTGGVAVDQERDLPSAAALKSHAELYPTLQDAINAIGAGGVVNLKAGYTYIVDRALVTLPFQEIKMNGATIRRRDQIIATTLTALVPDLGNVVELDDASEFSVGMQIAFAQAGVDRSDLVIEDTLTNIRTITGKAGNTITMDGPVDAAIDAGGTCFLTFVSLRLANGARNSGGTMDGNCDNWPFARWEVTAEIETMSGGKSQHISQVRFVDTPGEAIIAYGDDQRFRENIFRNIGGNAYHLSGVNGALITGDDAEDGNRDIAVGHGDGYVSASNGNSGIVITKNKAKRFIGGVGAANDTDALFIVDDNDFDDMFCYGVQGDGEVSMLFVTNNRMPNAGTNISKKPNLPYYGCIVLSGLIGSNFTIHENSGSAANSSCFALAISSTNATVFSILNNPNLNGKVELGGLDDFEVANNKIGRQVMLYGLKNGDFHHNRMNVPHSVTYGLRTVAGYAFENVGINDNTVNGSKIGIYIDPGAIHYRSFSVKRNKARNQELKAIYVPVVTNAADCHKVSVNDNEAATGPQTLAEYYGYQLEQNGFQYDRNEIENYLGAANRCGFLIGPSMNRTVLRNSVVKGAWQFTMLLTENSGVHVVDSTLDGADVAVQTGNHVLGSIVLPL